MFSCIIYTCSKSLIIMSTLIIMSCDLVMLSHHICLSYRSHNMSYIFTFHAIHHMHIHIYNRSHNVWIIFSWLFLMYFLGMYLNLAQSHNVPKTQEQLTRTNIDNLGMTIHLYFESNVLFYECFLWNVCSYSLNIHILFCPWNTWFHW